MYQALNYEQMIKSYPENKLFRKVTGISKVTDSEGYEWLIYDEKLVLKRNTNGEPQGMAIIGVTEDEEKANGKLKFNIPCTDANIKKLIKKANSATVFAVCTTRPDGKGIDRSKIRVMSRSGFEAYLM